MLLKRPFEYSPDPVYSRRYTPIPASTSLVRPSKPTPKLGLFPPNQPQDVVAVREPNLNPALPQVNLFFVNCDGL
ncbi:hypothetical protein GCM10027159_33050 [Lysobacter terrae]